MYFKTRCLNLRKIFINNFKFLIAFFVILLFSNVVSHAVDVTDEYGFSYSIDSNNIAVVSGYSGSENDIVIPKTVTYNKTTYDVKAINATAFLKNNNITSVKGETITKIEDADTSSDNVNGAFRYCSSLRSINFENLVYLGNHAFNGCTSLEKIDLPNVTYIGSSVFKECNLSYVVSLPNVLYLGENAFWKSKIKSLELPNVTYIGNKAFHECKGDLNVNAPNVAYFNTNNSNNDIFVGFKNIGTGYLNVSKMFLNLYYPYKPDNVNLMEYKTINENGGIINVPTPATLRHVNTFGEISNKIADIKTELSTNYGISENNINSKVLGNCLIKIEHQNTEEDPLKNDYNYAYAVKFYPSDYNNIGIPNKFTDIVYLIYVNEFVVEFGNDNFTYNGLSQIPTVTIKNGRSSLLEGVDYSVTGSTDSTNAGYKSLNIKLTGGNYKTVKGPNSNDNGMDDSGNNYLYTISKATIPPFTVNINENNMYTGFPIQLIASVSTASDFSFGSSSEPNLYLRIADNEHDLPTTSSWVQITFDNNNNPTNLDDSALKRTNVGTYYIYYYVDGGNNYNDVDASDNQSSPESQLIITDP